jgi:class 3 adenylate cyclase
MRSTRLLAILLTDLSGFTAFSSTSDRTDVMSAVGQQKALISPIIDSFHGRIVKWIGDAVLAVFDSATDAVLCGRRIQEQFVGDAERGERALPSHIKVVVHAGDVTVDDDGDIYGDAVNTTARLEKVAEPGEIYFTAVVRGAIPRAEVPSELVGEYEFKGLPDRLQVFRSCFGTSPIVRHRLYLVQTNFAQTNDLADEMGWDALHPVLDEITDSIIQSTRVNGGASRGVMQTGCFLTFPTLVGALRAVDRWSCEVRKLNQSRNVSAKFRVRTGIHWGTLHLMKHTIFGKDVDVLRTLAPLGYGEEVLFTHVALAAARADGFPETTFKVISVENLRECNSRLRWIAKFSLQRVFELPLGDIARLLQGVAEKTPEAGL